MFHFSEGSQTSRRVHSLCDGEALNRFEVYSKYRDFKTFHFEQAIAFKKHLAEQKGQQPGKKMSKATLHAILNQLKRFFQWLAREQGYKSRIHYSDAEYFNPHSFRNTIVQLGQGTPAQFKAWSQNLGHEKVLTTFLSYGKVACLRQGEIILALATKSPADIQTDAHEIAEVVFERLRAAGVHS